MTLRNRFCLAEATGEVLSHPCLHVMVLSSTQTTEQRLLNSKFMKSVSYETKPK